MTDSFVVNGHNILLNNSLNYKKKPVSRKIFKMNWWSCEEFKHEIANHYRDYKHYRKTHPPRQDDTLRRRKLLIARDQIWNYREVLPVNRINFPQSTPNTFRQSNQANCCRLNPLGAVYNDTLRRILSANTIDDFKFLARHQERLDKVRTEVRTHRRIPANHPHTARIVSCTSLSTKKRILGHIPFERFDEQSTSSSNIKVNDKNLHVNEHSNREVVSEKKDRYFAHLASECYNEGFLAHIKYLESIGERNTKNNQISELGTKSPPRFEGIITTSRPQSTEANVTQVRSLGFASVVKRIVRNCRSAQNSRYSEKSKNLNIRVNITRSSLREGLHSDRCSTQELQDMSDILHPKEGQRQTIPVGNDSSVKCQNFHDLIENLNHLEISELGSLPRIVLTDFSTTTSTIDSAISHGGKSHENTLRKQQSLEVDVSSLTDYNSEARPP